MATDKPRTTITMTQEMADAIREYQHQNKFSNMTLAIIDLIDKGIKKIEAEDEEKRQAEIAALSAMDLTKDEGRLLSAYRKLNTHAQEMALGMVETMTLNPDYLQDTAQSGMAM